MSEPRFNFLLKQTNMQRKLSLPILMTGMLSSLVLNWASNIAGKIGLTGLYSPEEWGGQGLPLSEGIQVYEQLGLMMGLSLYPCTNLLFACLWIWDEKFKELG